MAQDELKAASQTWLTTAQYQYLLRMEQDTRTLIPRRLASFNAMATSLLVKLYAATSIVSRALLMALNTLVTALPAGENPVVIRASEAMVVRGVSKIVNKSVGSKVLIPVIMILVLRVRGDLVLCGVGCRYHRLCWLFCNW